jgi:hypothetical protein
MTSMAEEQTPSKLLSTATRHVRDRQQEQQASLACGSIAIIVAVRRCAV